MMTNSAVADSRNCCVTSISERTKAVFEENKRAYQRNPLGNVEDYD